MSLLTKRKSIFESSCLEFDAQCRHIQHLREESSDHLFDVWHMKAQQHMVDKLKGRSPSFIREEELEEYATILVLERGYINPELMEFVIHEQSPDSPVN